MKIIKNENLFTEQKKKKKSDETSKKILKLKILG